MSVLLHQEQALESYLEGLLEGPQGAGADRGAGLDYLRFVVAGINLALPAPRVQGIWDWPRDLSPESDGRRLLLGHVPHDGSGLGVADTAVLVIPRQRRQALIHRRALRYTAVIVIEGGLWGLACERVGTAVQVDPSRVHWRGAGASRSWLAGTLEHERCALLDMDGVLAALAGEARPEPHGSGTNAATIAAEDGRESSV